MKGRIFTHSLGLLLLAAYVAVLLFACYTYLVVGHWPSYNNPDPGTLTGAFIPASIIALLLLGAALSVVIYPTWCLGIWFDRKFGGLEYKYGSWWAHGAFLIGIVIWGADLLFFHVMDPHQDGLLNWFFD